MARPIPYDYRKLIVKLRQSGKTYSSIASELGYSLKSIKRIWYAYQERGEEALSTNYQNSGRKSPYPPSLHEQINTVKDGDQGAPYVRSRLLSQNIVQPIPHERTIQRWWRDKGIERPKGNPKRRSNWTDEPGHTYQIDGKGYITLKDSSQVSWIKVADEATGSDLVTTLFPSENSRSD